MKRFYVLSVGLIALAVTAQGLQKPVASDRLIGEPIQQATASIEEFKASLKSQKEAIASKPLRISKAVAAETLLLDSTVVSIPEENLPYSRQIYSYTNENLPSICEKWNYNESNNNYYYNGEIGYAWNEAGYCTSRWETIPGYGEKYEYTLDADNYMTSLTFLCSQDENLEVWTPQNRTTYAYDSNHQVVEQTDYTYSTQAADLVLYRQQFAEYDELGRMISYLNYEIEDGNLVPEKEIYTYCGDSDLMASKIVMKNRNGELVNYQQRIYEYTDFDEPLAEYINYWNTALQSWAGGEAFQEGYSVNYNGLISYIYDDLNRLIKIESSQKTSAESDYDMIMVEAWNYEDEDDGAFTVTYTVGYVYGSEVVDYMENVEHHLAWGGIDYSLWKDTQNGPMMPTVESTVEFNEAHQDLDVKQWQYSWGNKFPSYRVLYQYPDDDPYNWESLTIYQGGDSGNPDDWVEDTVTTREFSHGTLTDYSEVYWNPWDLQWEQYSDFHYEFDFSVDGACLVSWTDDFDYMPVYETEYRYGTIYRTDYYYNPRNTNSVISIQTESAGPDTYYHINGIKADANNLIPGLYIRVSSDGKAQKVLIK